jgi:hypothetical protein
VVANALSRETLRMSMLGKRVEFDWAVQRSKFGVWDDI